MKWIIDLDENVFTRLFDNGVETSSEDREAIDRAIRNGKPYKERPTGYWIKNCDSCDCSNCYNSGARFARTDCSGRCSNCGELQCCTDNYCPTCGADMRGDKE